MATQIKVDSAALDIAKKALASKVGKKNWLLENNPDKIKDLEQFKADLAREESALDTIEVALLGE